MNALILAGGFGTRLKSMVPDLPKPMAPVAGRPFLEYILDRLSGCDLERIILSVGYRHESIRSHFGDDYRGHQIEYVIEDTPLGTGGAIRKAIDLKGAGDYLILNGDTYLDLDFSDLIDWYASNGFRLAMVLKQVDDVARYGAVTVENEIVTGFSEKHISGPGLINAGVYLMRSSVMQPYRAASTFSFETEFLQANIGKLRPHAYVTDCFFIDIGVPADYQRAQTSFAQRYNS